MFAIIGFILQYQVLLSVLYIPLYHCLCSNKCIVVLCTYLSEKEPHRQVGISMVQSSGTLYGVIVNILSWNARNVGSIPALGTIFPISMTPTTLVAAIMILYKLYAAWLLNILCVCICNNTACMFVIIEIERLTIPREQLTSEARSCIDW